jgi:ABC-type nitrate/sulfonate/bicarbonate transport system permease component
MNTFRPAVDIHIVAIASMVTIAGGLFLGIVFGSIAAIVFCQFPLMTRAFSPNFRGWNYVFTNESLIGVVVFGISFLIS